VTSRELTPIHAHRRPAAPAKAVNPVVLALVVALRDVEQRRIRGKVPSPVDTQRPAA
jgi:hypothetical protein